VSGVGLVLDCELLGEADWSGVGVVELCPLGFPVLLLFWLVVLLGLL